MYSSSPAPHPARPDRPHRPQPAAQLDARPVMPLPAAAGVAGASVGAGLCCDRCGCGALGVVSGVAAALLTLLTPAAVSSAVLIVTPLVTLVLAVLVVWRAGRAAASTDVDHTTAKVVEDFNRKQHR